MRARDVDHSMSIVACDLSMNKIMHKNTKDVEGQLHINYKFNHDTKNKEIQLEVLKKKHSRKEHGRTRKK